ncbi:MAG TPA: mechanosensitive ion channel family protein [Candidatus Saccharimonadales bacterium]|nr:mechanosensitive ion channel family protein [Candidatus Saccharimonadales bacterium]
MKTHYIMFIAFLLALAVGIFMGLLPAQALSPFGITGIYAELFKTAVIVVFGLISTYLLSATIINYGKNKPRMDERSIAKLVNLLGYAIIALLLLSAFKVNITGVLVGAGFLGIVIGLASQATLGNLFAGVSMMAAKPFAEGDRVTFSTWQYGLLPPSYSHNQLLPGYTGIIVNLGLMYTRIRLDEGTIIFVPNGVLNQAVIINYTISDIIEIKIRVELNNKVSFPRFRQAYLKSAGTNRKLDKLLYNGIDLRITDVGLLNYGVTIKANTRIEKENYVQSELAELALKLSTSKA